MTLRSIAPFGLAAGLLSFGLLLAQQPAAAGKAEQRGERRALAGRVAELEKQVADLNAQVAKLRARPATPAPIPAASDIKIFTLENASAQQAAPILTSLFGSRRSDDSLRIAVDDRTNSVVAAGPQEQLATIEAVLMRLDETAPAGPKDNLQPLPSPQPR